MLCCNPSVSGPQGDGIYVLSCGFWGVELGLTMAQRSLLLGLTSLYSLESIHVHLEAIQPQTPGACCVHSPLTQCSFCVFGNTV